MKKKKKKKTEEWKGEGIGKGQKREKMKSGKTICFIAHFFSVSLVCSRSFLAIDSEVCPVDGRPQNQPKKTLASIDDDIFVLIIW